MEKIGLFGGSFDPVHIEHISIAKEAIKLLNLDRLIIIPTNIAPHKKDADAISGEDRFNMLKLAFAGEKNVEISDFEIKNKGVSYSYLTVTHYANLYKNSSLYFLMGSDMLYNFPTWKNPEVITKLSNLVLISRSGSEALNDRAIKTIKELYNHKVINLNIIGKNLSSTDIRTRLKLSLPINNLTSSSVINYICKNNLYEGDALYKYVVKTLPEKRRVHTLGVITTAKKLAKQLGANEKQVEIASLLHDIAKYEDYKNYTEFKLPENCPKDVIHQFLGEFIARTKLNVKDEGVLNAIKYHTTGRANMSLLEKIVYVADLIEPSRTYKMVDDIRKAVFEDFESGFKYSVNEVLNFLQEGGGEVYYLTLESAKYYS